jgi:hypothetical protein
VQIIAIPRQAVTTRVHQSFYLRLDVQAAPMSSEGVTLFIEASPASMLSMDPNIITWIANDSMLVKTIFVRALAAGTVTVTYSVRNSLRVGYLPPPDTTVVVMPLIRINVERATPALLTFRLAEPPSATLNIMLSAIPGISFTPSTITWLAGGSSSQSVAVRVINTYILTPTVVIKSTLSGPAASEFQDIDDILIDIVAITKQQDTMMSGPSLNSSASSEGSTKKKPSSNWYDFLLDPIAEVIIISVVLGVGVFVWLERRRHNLIQQGVDFSGGGGGVTEMEAVPSSEFDKI